MRPQVLLVFLTRFEESATMLKGISQYQRSHGQWSAFLDDEARAETDPQWVRRKRWQGVISRHTTPSLAALCTELRIPLVDLNDTPPHPGIPKIRPDNSALGAMGAAHFLERGFVHFGFCGYSDEHWARERRDGFMQAIARAGHPTDLFETTYPGDVTPLWDARQTEALATWLRRLPKPVGLMCCNDQRALQAMNAAHDAGLSVPDDVAVLGANNDAARCELAYPPLSSVAPNAFRSGYAAAELLDAMIRGDRRDAPDIRIDPVDVVLRRSSDVLAVHDRGVAAAMSWIREHALHGVSVQEVVRQTGISRSQLERRFRRCFGCSPQAEIRRVQLARVKQLLLETDFPLKKIADLTGFGHMEYLWVVFKRFTGCAPGEYRQRVQQMEKPHRHASPDAVRSASRPPRSALVLTR